MFWDVDAGESIDPLGPHLNDHNGAWDRKATRAVRIGKSSASWAVMTMVEMIQGASIDAMQDFDATFSAPLSSLVCSNCLGLRNHADILGSLHVLEI